MVIWITGLSGSGKSTLCGALEEYLRPRLSGLVAIDGDVIREAFGNDLDYTAEGRFRQITRLGVFARFLSEQGLVVLVAALYSHPKLMTWNRTNIDPYFEVYLKAPLELLRARDPKGLYSGDVTDVVGVDIHWHEPQHPDMVIDAAAETPAARLAEQIIGAVPGLLPAMASTAR